MNLKLILTIVFTVLMLGANALLYIFLFRTSVLLRLFNGFFSRRTYLVLLIYNICLILPIFVMFFKRTYQPHVFMGHGFSGVVFVLSSLGYFILCMSVIPYRVYRSDRPSKLKIYWLLLCVVSAFCGLLGLLGTIDFRFAN